jgi:predicted nuclease with RNAse H fold
MVCWGIDVGARLLHGVALDAGYGLIESAVFDTDDLPVVCAQLAGAAVVAIDAPAGLSTLPHRDDESINRKFRTARCGEVALGRDHGYWVPFVSPAESAPAWMEVGFTLHAAAREHADEVIEVYPHAGFRELARGAQLPRKSSAAGVDRRIALLREAGVRQPNLSTWSHHALDAAVAAITAVQRHAGVAVPARCDAADGREHDGSSIWLPARL